MIQKIDDMGVNMNKELVVFFLVALVLFSTCTLVEISEPSNILFFSSLVGEGNEIFVGDPPITPLGGGDEGGGGNPS